MNSQITFAGPSGSGKPQFMECVAELVKLFYGESATIGSDGVKFDGKQYGDFLKLDIKAEGRPSVARQRDVIAIMRQLNSANRCDKTMRNCRERFNGNESLPFGGFPAAKLLDDDVSQRNGYPAVDALLDSLTANIRLADFDPPKGVFRVDGVSYKFGEPVIIDGARFVLGLGLQKAGGEIRLVGTRNLGHVGTKA